MATRQRMELTVEDTDSSNEDGMESGNDTDNENSTFDFTTKTWKDDVAFVICSKKLYASKVVLALASPVFEAMFGSDFSEKYQGEIELPGKHFEHFHEFLRCLYPNIKKPITISNVYKVLPLADEYQVQSVKKKCEKFLQRYAQDINITAESLLTCLAEVNLHNLTAVKDICINQLLEKNPNEILNISGNPVPDDIMAMVLRKVVAKQNRESAKLHTNMIKAFMQMDMLRGFNTPELHGFEQSLGATIKHKVKNVSKLKWQKSRQVILWNFKFNAFLKISAENFGFFLQCEPPEGIENWSCEVKGILIMKKHHQATDPTNRCLKISHTFTPEKFDWGFGAFEKMEKVLNPMTGYIKNDQLKVKIHFIANKPTWVET